MEGFHRDSHICSCIYVCSQGRDHKAYAPKFPKPKDEGWLLVLGIVDTGELVALKRLGQLRTRTFCSLAFTASHLPERKIYTVYLISDCYFGIDQQYDIHIETISLSQLIYINALIKQNTT